MVKEKTLDYHQRHQLSKFKEVPARWDGCGKTLFGVSLTSAAAACYFYATGDCSSFSSCAFSIVETVASGATSLVTGICLACGSEKICKDINKENKDHAKHQRLFQVLSVAFAFEEKGNDISSEESAPIVDMTLHFLDDTFIEITAADIAKIIREAVYAGYFLPAKNWRSPTIMISG